MSVCQAVEMLLLGIGAVYCLLAVVHCNMLHNTTDVKGSISHRAHTRGNASDHDITKYNRRRVLIVNGDQALRNAPESAKLTHSLLYQEYGDDNKTVNQFYMYNLQDVSKFFELFLDTKLCYQKC